MNCKAVFSFAVVFLVALALLSGSAHAASSSSYRKPPFNGSIFGKRGSGDAESRSVAFYALCGVALDACSTWMAAVAQDSK